MKPFHHAPLAGALLSALFLAGCGSSSRTASGADRPTLSASGTLDVSRVAASGTVLQNLQAIPELSAFTAALQQTGLADELGGTEPVTVFAPTNEAFAGADLGQDDLENVLRYHIVEGEIASGDFDDGTTLVTLSGENATLTNDATDLLDFNVDDADIVHADVEASNGVIHVINLVLNPIPGGAANTD